MAALDILSGKKATATALDYAYESLSGFNKAFFSEFGCLPSESKKRTKEAMLYYKRRTFNMYQLSDRCENLRKTVVDNNSYEKYYCMQYEVSSKLGMLSAIENNGSNTEIIASGIINVLESFLL